jgi:hypothetical protein
VSGLFHALLLSLALLLAGTPHLLRAADPITTRTDEVGTLLNDWAAKGTAAGLSAITYENRDDAHSMLPLTVWPGLKNRTFTEEDRNAGRHKGPANLIHPSPSFGNCSMAAPADRGGSLPRFYFMEPSGSIFLAKQFLSNQLYLYPEHQDHDPGGNGIGGWGDLFFQNTPAILIPQGSSGSDQPFLQALLSTTAAFSPEVQRTLIDRRLLAPTLQHLLRRYNKRVGSDADYLTGKAHPIVFDATHLDELQMVLAANRMTQGGIPPVVLINIQDETEFEPGTHFFEPESPHPWKLATSPVSIARLFRGNQSHYKCTLSTQGSGDLLGRPLTLRAVVLQGDPSLISIKSDPGKNTFQLTIPWQPPEKTSPSDGFIRSHRIDIGIFADNGITVSTPAIFSLYMFPNERRFYDEKGRVTEIAYQASNPDLGLPSSDSDSRWIDVIQTAIQSTDTLAGTLMERALEAPELAWFRVTSSRLSVLKDRLTRTESDPDPKTKSEVVKQQRLLAETLKENLTTPLPGSRKLSARLTLETAFQSIARFTDLYPSFQTELNALALKSPQSDAPAALISEVQKLVDWGILIRQSDDRLKPQHPKADQSPAETAYLYALNLTVLSHILYPKALVRQAGPAWVDPRLTTRKSWRDVYRYDDNDGSLLGWTRYLSGRTARFDSQGRLLPDTDSPNSKTARVSYFSDPETGLRFEPTK